MKVARDAVEVPSDICLSCFNSQQQFTFPFLVYCSHNEALAVVRSAHESTTFRCKPEQLEVVLDKLRKKGGEGGGIPGGSSS
jgi:hypothetical protein